MAFEDYEYTTDSGEPFYLYDFVRGSWSDYITSKATEFVVTTTNQTYRPVAISHGKVRQGEDVRKDTITITIPRGDNLTSEFINMAPETTTSVTIRKMHRGMSFDDAVVIWKGRVVAGEPKQQQFELSCESVFTAMRRTGIRLRCELICQHALYDSECGVDQAEFETEEEVVTMPSATEIEVDSITQDDGWFSGGILKHGEDTRFITRHSGDTVIISRPLPGLEEGEKVFLYPGCDRTLDTCKDKFDNKLNFLGFPWFPGSNPFQVSIK